MLQTFKNNEIKFISKTTLDEALWINLIKPTSEEILKISEKFDIPEEFLNASLDTEEKSRIEIENDVRLIIVDIPIIDSNMPEYEAFTTLPMAIIVTPRVVITVCTYDTPVLKDFSENKIKNINLHFRPQFVFTILIRLATLFHDYLYRIEKTSTKIESQLNENLKNEQLLQLLALSKSLTYFTTSLKASEITIKKMFRGHILKLYDEDIDLLEDALIEISQAIEMASSYSMILKATMETYSSITSNNLNVIMKVLSVITIVMAVPEIIFGFYGMNVEKLPLDHFYWFPILIALIGSWLIWLIIKKSKFYK